MKLISWRNREWDIILDDSTPCKYIEDLIAPLIFKKKWISKRDKFFSLESKPFNEDSYYITYNIKSSYNEDNEELKFIMYLVEKAVDYINNLEVLLTGDEYDTEDDNEIPF